MIDGVCLVSSYGVDKLPFYLTKYPYRRPIRMAEVCMFTTDVYEYVIFQQDLTR